MNRRQIRALSTALLLTGTVAALGVPASGEQIRTQTGLGGYSISANGAPFKVLLDDPSNPLPRPEDEAIVEADPSFTLAEVAAGPASRGLASSLWPGNLLGSGIGAASGGQLPNYPVLAQARFPDRPYVADDQTGGNAMHATALGVEASATAAQGPKEIRGSVDLGSATSSTTASVDTKNIAIGRAESKASNISLLGAIKIGSVSTFVETRSDGTKQTSSGKTVVAGLSVAGQAFVVDETGAHPAGGSGTPPLPLGQLDPLQQAGITISGIGQSTSSTADGVKRDSKGLRITVDTTLYRKALNGATPGPVTDALYQLFGALPLPPQAATYRSFLYYTLSATPKISFVIGAATSFTVANLPLTFDTPVVTGPGFTTGPPPVAAPGGTSIFPPSAPIVAGAPAPVLDTVVPSVSDPAASVAPPTANQPQTTTVAARSGPVPVTGVGALLVLGALVASGLGAWGLQRFQRPFLAGGGAVVGQGCTLGAPSSFPNLRTAPGATT